MNIVQIAPYYPPYLGGQERFVFSLSRQLARMGHDVTVLTSGFPDQLPHRFEDEGIRVFRYRPLIRPLRNPISPGMLLFPQSIDQADVIHTHNEHSFSSNAAVLLGLRYKKPVVLTVHGRLVMASRVEDFVVNIYENTISRVVFRAAAGITVITPSERERLFGNYHLPETQVTFIPVGIDLDHWDSLRAAPHSANAWENYVRDKKVILVAAQLVRRKGIDFLIRAMPRILSAAPDTILLIAGSGNEESNLRQLADSLDLKDRVLFLGRIYDEELSAAYQAADVFVLPSLSEGMPTCVMEALAHEKPVVATRIDGARDCFSEVADLVAPADSDALADGVLRVLSDPARAIARGKAGRLLMEKEYTWLVVAGKMVAVYEAAIEQKRPRGR
jgi:glycosyltransferase involved in cell wall biosynthesis